MTAIDLFAGCGGLSRGFLDAGIDVVLGVDSWPDALDVYRRNLGITTLRADLDEIPKLPLVDLLVGGPPCQDFSSSGNRTEGARAGLTEAFADIVARYRPRFMAYENVPRAKNAASYRRAIGHLSRCGYGLSEVAAMDASLYGVPQRRKRLILVGVLGGRDEELRGVLTSGASACPMTVRDHCESVELPLSLDHYYHASRYHTCRSVWSVDEPGPTLCQSSRLPLPPGYRRHKKDSTADLRGVRALSLREASLLQTFPPTWDWCDTRLTDAWVMLANAVPPTLGTHLGRVLLGVGETATRSPSDPTTTSGT